MKIPEYSPWGKIQDFVFYSEDIATVHTASHGGMKLSRKANAKIPIYMRRKNGWYEEDCEWCFVVLNYKELFPCDWYCSAQNTLKDYYPDEYEMFYGRKLEFSESKELQSRKFKSDTFDKFVVRSAFGSWKKGVPEGMVLVLATKRSTNECKHFLIPKENYTANFIIDEDLYKPVFLSFEEDNFTIKEIITD